MASYGHDVGPLSARVVAAARMDSSPARPSAVMNLIEDRRRRSCMEWLLPCPLGTSRGDRLRSVQL